MATLMKIKLNTIKIGHKLLIIDTILIIRGSESGKTTKLLNLIDNQSGIDKIYLYVKDPYEAKYRYLINIR